MDARFNKVITFIDLFQSQKQQLHVSEKERVDIILQYPFRTRHSTTLYWTEE